MSVSRSKQIYISPYVGSESDVDGSMRLGRLFTFTVCVGGTIGTDSADVAVPLLIEVPCCVLVKKISRDVCFRMHEIATLPPDPVDGWGGDTPPQTASRRCLRCLHSHASGTCLGPAAPRSLCVSCQLYKRGAAADCMRSQSSVVRIHLKVLKCSAHLQLYDSGESQTKIMLMLKAFANNAIAVHGMECSSLSADYSGIRASSKAPDKAAR